MARRVRQVDIARRLGISQATVSLVLSGRAGRDVTISPELRERVLRAARDLDYRADPVARSLAGGRTRLLGVVSPGPVFPGGAVLAGIEREATARRYDLVLFTGAGATDRVRLADGGLLFGPYPDDVARLTAERFPFLVVDPAGGEEPGRRAVRTLIDEIERGR